MRSSARRFVLRLALLVEYAVRHWLTSWWPNLRRLTFAVVLLGLLTGIAGFLPAVRFQATAAYEHAGYAVRVNGPMTFRQVSQARSRLRIPMAAITVSGAMPVTSRGRSASADIYVLASPADQERTWFTRPLLIAGRALRQGDRDAVVVASDLAHGFHLRPGSEIALGMPSHPPRSVRVRVVGVYAASGPIRSSVLASPGQFATLPQTPVGGQRWTVSDVFAGTASHREEQIRSRLQSLFPGPNMSFETRGEELSRARKAAADLLGAASGTGIPVAVGLITLFVLLREQLARLRRRRRELGLLISFGLPDGSARSLLVGESLVEALLAGLFGLWLGRWLLFDKLMLFLPTEVTGRMAVAFGSLVFAVAIFGYVLMSLMLQRRPLGQLLEEG